MACDRQIVYGAVKMQIDSKILRLNQEQANKIFNINTALVGFAGAMTGWGKFIEWLANMEEKRPKLGDTELIALTPKGIYIAHSLKTWHPITDKYCAIGSGMPFAMAAMVSGKTPKDAVEVSSKLDPNTGLGVVEYTL